MGQPQRSNFLKTLLLLAVGSACLGGGCSCGASEQQRKAPAPGEETATKAPREELELKERKPRGRLVAEHHINRGLSFRLEQREGRDEYVGSVLLERKEGDAWTQLDGIKLSLHPSCAKFDKCRPLRAGGVAAPPAYVWPVKLGARGTAHAECPCEECMKLTPGEYRLLAKTCGGNHKLASQSFWVASGQ